jgi:hypothetical protein
VIETLVIVTAVTSLLSASLAHVAFATLGYGPIAKFISGGLIISGIGWVGLSVAAQEARAWPHETFLIVVLTSLTIKSLGAISISLGFLRLVRSAHGWWS